MAQAAATCTSTRGVTPNGYTDRSKDPGGCANSPGGWPNLYERFDMADVTAAVKKCIQCNIQMPANKRPHAVYCTRKCKMAASEKRRPKRDDRARYLKEREHRLEYAGRYQRENPHVPKRAKRKRKARMAGAGVLHISARDWLRTLNRHGGRCFYCGTTARMSMDHVVPISRDGQHSIGNVLPACIGCNSSKGHRTIMEWRLGRSVRRARVTSAAAQHRRPDVA